MFNKFVEFIYPVGQVHSISRAWQQLSVREEWMGDRNFEVMSALINRNGISVMIWCGAYYIVEMLVELMCNED